MASPSQSKANKLRAYSLPTLSSPNLTPCLDCRRRKRKCSMSYTGTPPCDYCLEMGKTGTCRYAPKKLRSVSEWNHSTPESIKQLMSFRKEVARTRPSLGSSKDSWESNLPDPFSDCATEENCSSSRDIPGIMSGHEMPTIPLEEVDGSKFQYSNSEAMWRIPNQSKDFHDINSYFDLGSNNHDRASFSPIFPDMENEFQGLRIHDTDTGHHVTDAVMQPRPYPFNEGERGIQVETIGEMSALQDHGWEVFYSEVLSELGPQQIPMWSTDDPTVLTGACDQNETASFQSEWPL